MCTKHVFLPSDSHNKSIGLCNGNEDGVTPIVIRVLACIVQTLQTGLFTLPGKQEQKRREASTEK